MSQFVLRLILDQDWFSDALGSCLKCKHLSCGAATSASSTSSDLLSRRRVISCHHTLMCYVAMGTGIMNSLSSRSLALFATCCAGLLHNAQQPLTAPLQLVSSQVEHAPRIADLAAELEEYIAALIHRWHVPGLAVAVVQGNETWAKVRQSPHLFFLNSQQSSCDLRRPDVAYSLLERPPPFK